MFLRTLQRLHLADMQINRARHVVGNYKHFLVTQYPTSYKYLSPTHTIPPASYHTVTGSFSLSCILSYQHTTSLHF